ncbi:MULTISPECIES: fatty acyl-AMP ligase [unclassified Nonomuraea]|uniref:fatty acyl-AMP ligase n=1 Tax=unclassified Nonomuraea TaxID=2593643 RepID=UPI0033FF9FC0
MRVAKQPDDLGYAFLPDGEHIAETMTYVQLDEAAQTIAASVPAPEDVILLYHSGLDFIRALFGCMYAGVAPAPVQVPRNRQGFERLRRIARDAATTTVLTTAAVRDDLQDRFGPTELVFVATDTLAGGAVARCPDPGDTALLQYTSGSTGDPKGVMVTHANFLSNLAETEELWPCGLDATVVSWLPLFHDMGLLFGVLLPLWAGAPCYLMPPEAFIRRPARWLEAISRFGGTHAAAPSFAYDLCVRAAAEGRTSGVGDLSSWRIAANGAEPVRWRTIQAFTETFAAYGFRPEAMTPGYGLAENTLKATGGSPDRAPTVLWLSAKALGAGLAEIADPAAPGATPIVSSGVPVLSTKVRIVGPDTLAELPPGHVGEIWVSGPCVAAGYLGRPGLSEETFRARVRGEPHLRTGDLGFLHEGELYVTGRLKDVIIRKGRNHYPQDLELSVESVLPGLRPNCAAAFSVDDGTRELLVIVVEADGRVLNTHGAQALRERVHDVVREDHRLTPDDVLVVRRGALPKTSSGKIQRSACRKHYVAGKFIPVENQSLSNKSGKCQT